MVFSSVNMNICVCVCVYVCVCVQRAKKVVSDSLGLMGFAIGLVNSILNLCALRNSTYRRTVKSICSSKNFVG